MARKARQWSNFQGELPDAPIELGPHEIAVRARVDELRLAKTPMKELALEYQALVEEDDFAEKAAKKRNIQYEALERVMLDELKKIEEMSGADMWRGAGQTFSPQNTLYPIVTDKAALRKHIEAEMPSVLDITAPRLKSLVTDILKSFAEMTPAERATSTVTPDAPLPGVKIFIKKGVHRTKTK